MRETDFVGRKGEREERRNGNSQSSNLNLLIPKQILNYDISVSAFIDWIPVMLQGL